MYAVEALDAVDAVEALDAIDALMDSAVVAMLLPNMIEAAADPIA